MSTKKIRLVTATEVADIINTSRQWVYRLYNKRAANGFPDVVQEEPLRWNEVDIQLWFTHYLPNPGGRPKKKRVDTA